MTKEITISGTVPFKDKKCIERTQIKTYETSPEVKVVGPRHFYSKEAHPNKDSVLAHLSKSSEALKDHPWLKPKTELQLQKDTHDLNRISSCERLVGRFLAYIFRLSGIH